MFWKKKKKDQPADDPAAPAPPPGGHGDAADGGGTEGHAPKPPGAPNDKPIPYTWPPPARR